MNSDAQDALRQAAAYLNLGEPQAALPILANVVRQFPNSEQGWWLLSQAIQDPKKQADCLRQVLRINPANGQARQQLDQMKTQFLASSALAASPMPAQETGATPPFTLPASETQAPAPVELPPNPASNLPSATPAEIPKSSKPEPKPKKPSKTRPPKKKRKSCLPILIAANLLILAAAAILVGYWYFTQYLPATHPLVAAPTETPTSPPPATVTPYSLPATWTPTTAPTGTLTPTVTLTPQPSATSTFLAPAPTAGALMARIQQEVSDLRGLAIKAPVQQYIVAPPIAEQMLLAELTQKGYLPKLKDEARVLSALGLIKPTYDMARYAMNGLIDNIGGFYRNDKKDIFLLSINFGGVEHFTYAHEFDHALVDQNYDIPKIDAAAQCDTNSDRCGAATALIEGDATLAMRLWFQQYATPQDYKDILSYRAPVQALPEQSPPNYVSQALDFPYTYGLSFVTYLHDHGNWAAVNKAYAFPPASTEQILHPEKFIALEVPVLVQDPSLDNSLDSSWRRIASDTLGEWTTYLVLRYGADQPAQLTDAIAKAAAAGWGGDHYQVYYSDQADQTVLAAHWAWDKPTDAKEFQQAMLDYLDQRYRGSKLNRPGMSCWEAVQQTSCLLAAKNEVLWLVAPDQTTLDKVLAAYPSFNHP